ncbi:hypothetical protein RDABS01_035503 [Bienertia sinuspersici]
MEDDTDTEDDHEGPIGQGVGLEDACPHDLDIELVNEREVMNIEEEGELNISGTTRKRETVYCRKLTMLPPGEKLNVEFDENGNAIGKCSRVDVLVASRTRKSKKAVNALTLEKNTLVVDEIKKLKEQRDQGLNDKTDEQIFQDVLGKDKHGYLRAYGPGKSITQHFKVKPSRLDLSQELIEVKKKADQLIEEARKDAENARTEAEKAKKEAEAVRNDVDRKIEQNNAIWEKKFHQLMNFIKGGTYSNDGDSGNGSSS